MFQSKSGDSEPRSGAVSAKDVLGGDSPGRGLQSLFSPKCTQDKYLLQMLRFADNVSMWVAAEIVTCHTAKLQTSILTKFLLVSKLCYEQRDFATAVQILGGLENLIVRQLPDPNVDNRTCWGTEFQRMGDIREKSWRRLGEERISVEERRRSWEDQKLREGRY
ncbi:unnamed protein product [Ranitomeya imitator]|uniref:Ras-GEF domain-containing protein n=1 Tax=Ranitomeya imitator TaxID=111125 RepID=A0ABN9LXD7_9NEOB|nr:unnamed protein product [Ranitomeya imitator]